MHSRRMAGFFLAVSIALAGAAASQEPPIAQVVVIEGVKFTPAVTIVKSGQWVQWINKDPFPHTVASPGEFDSRSIPAGGTWKHQMVAVGEFEYTCTLHPTMKGTLQVEKAQ